MDSVTIGELYEHTQTFAEEEERQAMNVALGTTLLALWLVIVLVVSAKK